MKHLLDVAFANDHHPRVHGNGFVQLDISANVRLHIWGHPRIPRQKTPTPIHDHMFGFSSLILRGRLTHVRYSSLQCEDGYEVYGTHWPYKAHVREKEDTILIPANTTRPSYVTEIGRAMFTPGCGYSMKPGEIHETIPECLSASIIIKDGRTLAQGGASPTVWVPVGVTPDNDFNRYQVSEEELWTIIQEALL